MLPQHLVQYQRDNSVNLSFTCRHSALYPKAMEVVRMRDASAAAFDHVFAGLDALLLSGAPFAEKRDGYGFEDHMAGLTPGTLPGNGEIAYVGDKGADRCISTGNSIRANGLHCLIVPEKQRGLEDLQTAERRHRTRGSVSAQDSAAFAGAGVTTDYIPRKRGCPEETTEAREMQELSNGRDRRTTRTRSLDAAENEV